MRFRLLVATAATLAAAISPSNFQAVVAVVPGQQPQQQAAVDSVSPVTSEEEDQHHSGSTHSRVVFQEGGSKGPLSGFSRVVALPAEEPKAHLLTTTTTTVAPRRHHQTTVAPRRKLTYIDSRQRAVATLPGFKHDEDSRRNEDAAIVTEYLVEQRLVRLSLVVDGHGPKVIRDIASPGRLVAAYSIQALRSAFENLLPDLIRSPVLLPSLESPLYLNKSRQAFVAAAFNQAQLTLLNGLPFLSHLSGATAAAMLFVADGPSVHDAGSLVAANMGDALNYAFEYTRNATTGLYDVHLAFLFGKEENIRILAEQNEFVRRARRLGYRPAAVAQRASKRGGRSKRSQGGGEISLVFVPASTKHFDIAPYEPFRTLQDLRRAIAAAALVVPKDVEYAAFAMLRTTYVTKVSSWFPNRTQSLQLTATLGDFAFTPVKKASRQAADVMSVRLEPRADHAVITLSASDGLWGAMQTQQRSENEYALLVQSWLNEMVRQGSGDPFEHLPELAQYLVTYAKEFLSDDITAAILGFNGLGVKHETGDVFVEEPANAESLALAPGVPVARFLGAGSSSRVTAPAAAELDAIRRLHKSIIF